MRLYANPYDTSASGFYFDSMDEYEAEYDKRLPVEEYEIDFIDGTAEEAAAFQACKPTQASIAEFFEVIDTKDGRDLAAYCWLRGDLHLDHDTADRKCDEVCLFDGSDEDYAAELVDEGIFGDVPDSLKNHIDYASIANDLRCGGDITDYYFAGTRYLVTNCNDF